MNAKRVIGILAVLVALWFVLRRDTTVRHGPGVLAPDMPRQEEIAYPEKFDFKEHAVTPLATFSVKGKVLSKKNYRWDRAAALSPVDLALGWGAMSDESVIEHIGFSQSGRWYRWWTDTYPVPRKVIEMHSANMHMVPANRFVASTLRRVRKGDIVDLNGSLIRIDARDGWHWVSSLSRTDTGNRSCEVVWVEEAAILPR